MESFVIVSGLNWGMFPKWGLRVLSKELVFFRASTSALPDQNAGEKLVY